MAHIREKKRMARKDAKAQRNKRLSPEDAKPACGRQGAKKKLFASLRLCAKKKINVSMKN